jgi:hypothetical protein
MDVVLPPDRVPTDWVGYTSLRAVVLGPDEWRQMTEPQRTAIRTWVACGGDLLIVDGDVPASFAQRGQAASFSESGVLPYLLGHVHRVASSELSSGGLSGTLSRLPAVRDANWTLPANRAAAWDSVGERGFRQPIAGVGEVRARTYLMILLLFSMVIGPLNFYFLRTRGQSALIVLTAPVLSAVFVLLIATYVVAGEGFGVHVRATTLTVLDQGRQAAATRGSASMYAAGRTPSGGLQFSRETAVFPLPSPAIGEQVRLDLSESQRFVSGLVQARTPANFETASFRVARERLVVSREASGLVVVNGLGATLNRLLVFDRDRVYELSSPLAAGERATLAAGGRSALGTPAGHPLSPRLYMLDSRQAPGTYIAMLDESPFWSGGVQNLREHDSTHILLGLLERMP